MLTGSAYSREALILKNYCQWGIAYLRGVPFKNIFDGQRLFVRDVYLKIMGSAYTGGAVLKIFFDGELLFEGALI